MNPRHTSLITFAAVLLAASSLTADIKTQEKTTFQMGGALGGLINKLAGDAAKDGVVSSVAVRGTRKMTANEQSGRIIDLAEEKVYDIDYRRKEYRVTTFAELRKRWQDAQAKAKKLVFEDKVDLLDASGVVDQELGQFVVAWISHKILFFASKQARPRDLSSGFSATERQPPNTEPK